MGSTYNVTCNDCLHAFEIQIGGGWLAYNKLCIECGNSILLPRRAPKDINHLMSENEIKLFLEDRSQWSIKGSAFEAKENEIIKNLTGHCECGGVMVCEGDNRIVYRCASCKSSNLNMIDNGILSD
jgi:hypothetical protein